ncbi:hypothetical protein NM688_g3609 [Phlebia brevispora]|uniref:Uncharacterized protein n=1 Tax=Phlebia brevispora TaxID=194682 RepID=A0ACC1T589_9APHY|nr:hypothetical protein NM688_g3609 [Phlebia brevispora]
MFTTADISKIRGTYKADLTYKYSEYASLTLVCYEFVITFRREYELVWTRKWTAARWLLLSSRYLVLVCILVSIVPYSAALLFQTWYVPSVQDVKYLPVDVPSILRFAGIRTARQRIYHRCRCVLARDVPAWAESFSLASISCTVAADFIAILVTWLKTYRHVREASSIRMNVRFGVTLLQYGALYFTLVDNLRPYEFAINANERTARRVLCTINVLYGLILLVPSLELVNPVNTFLSVLPNIVLARFLLNLRQINPIKTDFAAPFSMSSVSIFRTSTLSNIIGNLSEPLAAAGDDDNEDVEDPGDKQDNNSGSCKLCGGAAMHSENDY